MGRKPKVWTAIDRDHKNLRIGMQVPVPPRRHRDAASSRIDNILPIRECKLTGLFHDFTPSR